MSNTEWHLDRKVTLGVIIAILINAFSSIWWAASLNSEVVSLRKDTDKNMASISDNSKSAFAISERLARLEGNITYQTKIIERLDQKIDGEQ